MANDELSQLGVYRKAIEQCSDNGNRDGVEMLRGLIVELIKGMKDRAIKGLEIIDGMGVLTEMDRKNKGTHGDNILIYDGLLLDYSADSPEYKEFLSQADSNSWKQGRPPVY